MAFELPSDQQTQPAGAQAQAGFVLPSDKQPGFQLPSDKDSGGFTLPSDLGATDLQEAISPSPLRQFGQGVNNVAQATGQAASTVGQWVAGLPGRAVDNFAGAAGELATNGANVAGRLVGGASPAAGTWLQQHAAAANEQQPMTQMPDLVRSALVGNVQAMGQGAATSMREKEAAASLAQAPESALIRAPGQLLANSPVTPGTVGAGVMAALPAESVAKYLAMTLGIPTATGALQLPEGAAKLAEHLQPEGITGPWGAAAATFTDPEVAAQYPGAAMGLGMAAREHIDTTRGEPSLDRPRPEAIPDTAKQAPGKNYVASAMGERETIPDAPARQPDTSGLPNPGGRRAGSEVLGEAVRGGTFGKTLADVAQSATGEKTLLKEALTRQGGQEASDRATAALEDAQSKSAAGKNYISDFGKMVSNLNEQYGPEYSRRLFTAMDSIDRPDKGLQANQRGLLSDVSSPKGEATAYWTLKDRALQNFDQATPDTGDPGMQRVREMYAQYAAHQVLSEAQAGLHTAQEGQTGPQSQGFFHSESDSPQFQAMQLRGPNNEPLNPNAAEAQLRQDPSNYGSPLERPGLIPDGEARMERDQDVAKSAGTRAAAAERSAVRTAFGGARPATMGEADLPELPGKGDRLLSPTEKTAAETPLPGQAAVGARAQELRQALQGWTKDPVKSRALDSATAMLEKGGQPTPEGIQALKDAKTELEKRLADGPETADKYFKVVDELQRQAKQAGSGYAYSGQTLEGVTRNLEKAIINELQDKAGPATRQAAKFSQGQDAFTQRLPGDRQQVRDPAFAAKASWSLLTSHSAFKTLADGLKDSPFLADPGDNAKAIEELQLKGWVPVPEGARYGYLASKFVPKELWQAVAPYDSAYKSDAITNGVTDLANWVYRKKGVGSISAVNRNVATMLMQAHAHLGIYPWDWHRLFQEGLTADQDPQNYQKFRGMDYGITPGKDLPSRLGAPTEEMRPTSVLSTPGAPSPASQAWDKMQATGDRLRQLQSGSVIHWLMHSYDLAEKAIGDFAQKTTGDVGAATLSSQHARQTFGDIESIIRKGAAQLLIKDKGLSPEQAIAQSNQAFVDYNNKSADTKVAERYTVGVGNRFIHWPLAAAANTAKLLTSPNPIVWGRTLTAPLAAAAWAGHMDNMQDSLFVQKALANNPDAQKDERKKIMQDALAESQGLREQAARNVPDWVRGFQNNRLGSGVMEVPVKKQTLEGENEQGVPENYDRTNYVSLSRANPYDAMFLPLDTAFAVKHFFSDEPAQGGSADTSGILSESLPAKIKNIVSGQPVPGSKKELPASSAYNQAATMRELANVAAPPQIGQAMNLGMLQEREGSPAIKQVRGVAPDKGTELANRWLGAFGAWHNDPALQALKGANELQGQAGELDNASPLNYPDVNTKHFTEQVLPQQVRTLKGTARFRFGKQSPEE